MSGSATRSLDFFNKEIAVYFQRTEDMEANWMFKISSSDTIGRYIYTHWLRMHNGRAHFIRQHFLAKAMEFKPYSKDGDIGKHYSCNPKLTDVSYVLHFHESLCDALQARENDVLQDSGKSYLGSGLSAPAPVPFHLHVVDGCCEDHDRGHKDQIEQDRLFKDHLIVPATQPGPYRDFRPHERVNNWYLARRTVLLVKMGDGAHLSAPIDFLPLYDAGKVLPVERKDCDVMSAVRLRMDDALDFITHLLRREERLYLRWQAKLRLWRRSWMSCVRNGSGLYGNMRLQWAPTTTTSRGKLCVGLGRS